MAKQQEQQTYKDTQAQRQSSVQRQTQYTASKAPERAEARAAYTTGAADLSGKYSDFAKTGGIDSSTFNPIRSGYQTMGETGGIDPNIAKRVGQGYQDFSVTGGFTPQNLTDIRGRTSSQVGAQFGRFREGLDRYKRNAGGYAPGYQAATAKLARGQTQAATDATRDTELGIADQVRQGKLQGMQGELGLQESLRQGKQAGLQGQQQLEEFVRTGKLTGIAGLEHLNTQQLGEMMRYDANELSMMGLSDSAIQSLLSMQSQLAQRPGLFDNIMRAAGAAAGVGSAVMGLPGLGGKRQTSYGVGPGDRGDY